MGRQFEGFPAAPFDSLPVPPDFFVSLLPAVDNLAELKVLLFCFWALPQKQGSYPYLRLRDCLESDALMDGMQTAQPDASPEKTLQHAMTCAVERGVLLVAEVNVKGTTETLYFVNTEKGRTAVAQIKAGAWQPGDLDNPVDILPYRPTVFKLYETNIGPLTPYIVDDLKDLEKDYSAAWIQEAIHIAVQENKRSLRYVIGILKRWRKEGKTDDGTTGRQDQTDGKRYISGKDAEFINY